MENKQTAVEWLKEQLYSAKELDLAGVIDQALELEKQQIINAHLTGLIYLLEVEATKQATKYYSQTYKKPTE